MGVGRAVENKARIEAAVADLGTITGQKPVITKARRSISQFRLRAGVPIGAKVTLRGQHMFEFLERLIVIVLPRLRDFRGVPRKMDGRGNFSLGLAEQVVFPEINLDKVQFVQGMNITITDGRRRPTKRASPFSKSSASRSSVGISRSHRDGQEVLDPQSESRRRSSLRVAKTAASCAVVRAVSIASSASAGFASARSPSRARSPASARRRGKGAAIMTMTDPIADMLTRIRNACRNGVQSVVMPSSRLKVNIAKVLKDEGYIGDYEVHEDGPRAHLTLGLKYGPDGERVIQTIDRVSKPGCRRFRGVEDLASRAERLGHRDPLHEQRCHVRPPRTRTQREAARSSAPFTNG